MTKIPAEYTNVDFGFSAVDEATFKANQAEAEVNPPSIDENDISRVVLNVLSPIEDKLDLLIQRRHTEESDDVQFAIAQAEEEISAKVSELEKIIMPLLVNLLKTADKEYLYWPDRAEQLQVQIDNVLAITRK